MAGLVGLAVGALVVGGAWLVTGSSGSVDKLPIAAPERVGELVPFDQVERNKSERAARTVTRIRSWDEQSSQRLSQSHDGTAALVRTYSDQELRQQVTVMIYRARSPHPQYVPYQDAKELSLAVPLDDLQQFGEVSCSVRNEPTPEGKSPGPKSAHTISCARTGDALTVELRPTGSDLAYEPRKVAGLVDELWNAVS